MKRHSIARKLGVLFCVAVFSLGPSAACAMDGSGTAPGTLKEKLTIKGCSAQRWSGEITGFTMNYDGSWSLGTTGGAFTGTYSDIKPDKKFSMTLSPGSYDNLIAALEAGSDDLCGLAPETSVLTDITVRNFTAQLKKKKKTKRKAISFNLAIDATRQDAAASNTTTYTLKGKIGFVPSGCSGENVGSLPGSDALVYCGIPDPAVITTDNALELLADVIGSADTGPVLNSASTTGGAPQRAVAAGNPGAFAQRVARRLFNPTLYADADTDGPSLTAHTDSSLVVAAASIKINETESCDSGTMSLKGKLSKRGTGVLRMVFHDCLLDGDQFNGAAKLTIRAFDRSYLTFTDAVLDFTMLSTSGDSGDGILSGSMRYQLDMAANSETLTLNLVIQDYTADRAYQTEGLVITSVYDNWMYPNSFSDTYAGRFYDSRYGYVDITTLQPLAYSSELQPYPDQGGSLLLTGADDATILFTVLTQTTASMAVDTDGDGAAEYEDIINTSVINAVAGTPAVSFTAGGVAQAVGAE